MNHFVNLCDFSLKEVESILLEAAKIKYEPSKYKNSMEGKILATLFFEPSTRTRFSFQTAILRLGGNFIGFSNQMSSSVAKGENYKDTIKIVNCYSDILVIRHFLEGAAFCASIFSSYPVINAGDGKHIHPTQTLTDLMTILQYKKKLDGLCFGICGDLKFGRTVHSLVEFLTRYSNNKFFFVSHPNFRLQENFKEYILESGNEFFECESLEDIIKELDVLYMTRVQTERFKNIMQPKEKNNFIKLTEDILKFAKKDLIIMHPLPKRQEIEQNVDGDKRAVYFEQAANGVFVRMALILNLSNKKYKNQNHSILKEGNKVCNNENCITKYEDYLPKYYKEKNGVYFCAYCEQRL